MKDQLDEYLQSVTGRPFDDPELLRRALTHRSYVRDRGEPYTECNERLEFLGDSLLNMMAADYLFHRFPDREEGRLTRLRALMVCESALDIVAAEIGIAEALDLGFGEEQNGGRCRPSILADAVEAIIAALYLDGGLETARRFVLSFLPGLADRAEAGTLSYQDNKTRLQELVQKKPGHTLSYEILAEEGPAHRRHFRAGVCLDGEVRAEGEGASKKKAEQAAAGKLLSLLKNS